MREIKSFCYKGTRILVGNDKRLHLNKMVEYLIDEGFDEIQIPIIQPQDVFSGKVGAENTHLMFRFTDKGGREVCLAPEYTAVIQKLSNDVYRYDKDVKLFYIQECFRGEKPQAGRFRQFTQLGVEILNPSVDYSDYLETLALGLISTYTKSMSGIELNKGVVRGLDYYKEGKGFEVPNKFAVVVNTLVELVLR